MQGAGIKFCVVAISMAIRPDLPPWVVGGGVRSVPPFGSPKVAGNSGSICAHARMRHKVLAAGRRALLLHRILAHRHTGTASARRAAAAARVAAATSVARRSWKRGVVPGGIRAHRSCAFSRAQGCVRPLSSPRVPTSCRRPAGSRRWPQRRRQDGRRCPSSPTTASDRADGHRERHVCRSRTWCQ